MSNQKNKGGRNPKLDPATNRITVRFTSKEYMQFLNMFERSGASNKATFLKAQFFGQEFRVRTFDQSKHEYYARLSNFHGQFRMVGNNYNQVVKELKVHFSERRAMALTYKLEKCTMQLVEIMQEVKALTEKYNTKE